MKKIIFTLSIIVPLFAACTVQTPDEQNPSAGETELSGAVSEEQVSVMEVYLSEELCAVVEREMADQKLLTRSSETGELFSSANVISMERIFPYAGEYEERTRREGLHRFYRVRLSESVPATRASSELIEIEGIEKATPVRKIKQNSFNDPELKRQWHYYNDGSLGSSFSKGCDVNVTPVWESYTTGDPKVIVAVVDGGIDPDHTDLAYNYVGGYNFVSNSKRVTGDNHGTHVAGTIAATNNNGVGVCGIAGGDYAAGKKGVGLLSCQVFEGSSSAESFAAAIKWGADNGAVISQNSWGFDFKTDQEAAAAARAGLANYSPGLKAAIDYFIKYAGCDNAGRQKADSPMKGGVYISSAGNDNRNRDVIGEYGPVIAVGAVAPNFNKAYYSNYGSWVDIAAPGGDAQMGTTTQVYSTKVGTYGYFQGTSMACPHVSGVAALIISYYGGQGFTADKLTERLINGANVDAMKKTNERTYIGPLVDAFGSMTYGGANPPADVAAYTVTPKSNSLDFSWVVTADKDGLKAYGYELFASEDASRLKGLNPAKELPEGVISVKVFTEGYKVGQTMTGRITDLDFSKTYYTAIAGFNSNNFYSNVTNASGQSTTSADPTETETGVNHAPVVTVKGASSITLKAHETGTLKFSVADPDDHEVTVEFDGGSKAATCKSEDNVNYTVNINAPLVEAGIYTVNVTASDKYGLSATGTLTYTVLENHAPEKSKDVDNILMSRVGEKATLNMEDYIKDPDGETLTYSAVLSTSTNLTLSQDGNTIELRSTNFGETTVTMRGSDIKGKYCTLSFKVLARDPSIPIDVYPNPVVDVMTVRPYKATSSATVSVVSATGATVFEQTGASSPFEPVKVNMGSVAPGKYVVNASFDGETHQRTIVKQ